MKTYIIVIAVIAVILLWIIITYNSFIKNRNLVKEAFSGMDIYLKKRYDLIPNLIECVKGYMKHEQDTLSKIVELRSSAMKTTSVSENIEAQKQLTEGLNKLFALAESYPELKASEQFVSLQKDLGAIETDISQARKYYNGAVKLFNVKVESIPSNIIAALFRFKAYPYFEISASERENVKVEF